MSPSKTENHAASSAPNAQLPRQRSPFDISMRSLRISSALLSCLFLSFILSDIVHDKVPYEERKTTEAVEVYALGNPSSRIASLPSGTKILLLAAEGNQAYVLAEQPFSQKVQGIVAMDNTTAIHSFSIADRLGLFFQYDPIFAYLSTLTLFLSFIYFSEWKESDLVRLAKHQLGLSKSENMQLQQLIEKKDVQLDVLKKRHERELNQTAQSLQHDINRANEGLHKLEQELRKTEQQIESYEREADNNARMIERLQHQVDEEIAKRESTLKRAEEMEAEKESYRTEVIRITHMLNHKKIELEHLKKEIRTLRSSQTNAKAKQADKQLGERDYGRVLHLQGKVDMRDIKSNFRTLTRMLHPDRFENEDARTREISTRMFSEVKTAFEYFKSKYSR